MERRDFFKLIGSVSALSILSGCMGRNESSGFSSCDWPKDDGIQIRAGGPWDAKLNPTDNGQPPVNGFSFGAPHRTTPQPTAPTSMAQHLKKKRTISHPRAMSAVSRNAWNAQGVIASRMQPMQGINKITVHHEGNPKPNYDTTPSQVACSLRQIQNVHFKRLGAGDIAYHFVIDRQGLVWQGRNVCYQGAHTRGNNQHNVGIMCLGNFELQKPTNSQVQTLAELCATLCKGYHISPHKVYGHQELRSTACPGKNLFSKLCQIRSSMQKA